MEVILDSNFIISCVKRKIDFINELMQLGFKIVVPREVIQELKDLRLKVNRDERGFIDVGLISIDSKKVKKMGFGEGKIDEYLIQKGKTGAYIATLDSSVKRAVSNKVLISDAKNSLIVERI